MHVTEIHFEIT